ncbi:MAG TPA: hypothetical protein VLE72_01140 [Candidatus Saccharimonadales bacterium]|nr:hypothetical protein [Candidatus Saccharimonadales bacterium]
MSEALPGQPEPEFKPAINPADLSSDQPHLEDAFQAMPPDPSIEAHRQVEIDKAEREARRSDLLTQGYNQDEVNSIINSGSVLPEVFANHEPSDTYLELASHQESLNQKPQRSQSEAALQYNSQRVQLISSLKRSGSSDLSDEQIERIITYGYLMPPEYTATPATDLLAKRHEEEDLPKAA